MTLRLSASLWIAGLRDHEELVTDTHPTEGGWVIVTTDVRRTRWHDAARDETEHQYLPVTRRKTP